MEPSLRCRRRSCRHGCRAFGRYRAAVSGAICPLLLTPSVSRITTLLLAELSRSRLTAVPSPLPIAVPSSMMPLLTVPRILTSEALSVVSGLCVKLSPANTTRPIRSFGRSMMKLAAISFAAEIRRAGNPLPAYCRRCRAPARCRSPRSSCWCFSMCFAGGPAPRSAAPSPGISERTAGAAGSIWARAEAAVRRLRSISAS